MTTLHSQMQMLLGEDYSHRLEVLSGRNQRRLVDVQGSLALPGMARQGSHLFSLLLHFGKLARCWGRCSMEAGAAKLLHNF